ncbi:cytochrome b/b6 domain-containing protein [Pararhodobacter sp. SW119]|uniref:cytochrome b n=1 Tax=Pararhodobacter sp. SW119 TaxID=2780075 RepID=UPI001AE0DFFA|nr:cytochrome b/b6 domain-containing protein [Pararhodobacter sp. SW119]
MPARYHPALVVLHWALAFCLIGLLFAGTVLLAPLANDDPAKMLSFRLHMGLGLVTLFLMLLRLAVRLSTRVPPPAETGNAVLDRLARLNHAALYLLAFVMAGSGITFARASGLPDAVFGSGPMPPDFAGHTARQVHGLASRLFMALIALHIVAALWHHFIRRDGLMARMGFGRR